MRPPRQHYYEWFPEPKVSKWTVFMYLFFLCLAWGYMEELDYRAARELECQSQSTHDIIATYSIKDDACIKEKRNGKTVKN